MNFKKISFFIAILAPLCCVSPLKADGEEEPTSFVKRSAPFLYHAFLEVLNNDDALVEDFFKEWGITHVSTVRAVVPSRREGINNEAEFIKAFQQVMDKLCPPVKRPNWLKKKVKFEALMLDVASRLLSKRITERKTVIRGSGGEKTVDLIVKRKPKKIEEEPLAPIIEKEASVSEVVVFLLKNKRSPNATKQNLEEYRLKDLILKKGGWTQFILFHITRPELEAYKKINGQLPSKHSLLRNIELLKLKKDEYTQNRILRAVQVFRILYPDEEKSCADLLKFQ